MSPNVQDQIAQLQAAIAAQESLRPTLGDAAVDTVVALLRKQLAELEAQARPAEQQRKQVTVLFADVSGFTATAEAMDAEDVTAAINALWQRLDAVIAAHGGRIDKHIGDAVMALWGAEQAQEDDPEQAIRAALGMQSEIGGWRLEVGSWRPGAFPTSDLQPPTSDLQLPTSDLQLHIGIHTGPVLLGEVGTTREFTAIGDTVNLASRLQDAAPAGSIYITHDTYRHVRGLFDVQALTPFAVRGKAEPVQVYTVLRAKPRAFRLPTRGVEGVETRMIGRAGELQDLQEAFCAAAEKAACRVVTVVGEAGMGKSRLLYEFNNWLELLPQDIRFYKSRASQERQSLPYALLRDLFAFRFQIQDSDPAQEARDKFERGVIPALSPFAGEGEEGARAKTHFLGQLLGLDFDASPYIQAVQDDARQLHDRAMRSLAEFFQAEAARAPTVILLEDVHWADDSSLDAMAGLIQVLAASEQVPLLVVVAARPALFERRPGWGQGQDWHTRLALRPLSPQDSGRLVDEILQKVDEVSPALRELVAGGSEGNPLYIEELVKMLVEEGIIIKGEERWQVEAGRLAGLRVPPTLTGLLQARLDGLPPPERTTLQWAAVIGRIFWDRAVAYIGQAVEKSWDEPRAAALLAALRSKEIIFRREMSAFAGVEEYIFKHAILREVTYESILKRLRPGYHALAAAWLLEQSGERQGEFTGLIAEHLDLAGETERALVFLRRAGEQAAAHFANAEAVNYLRRALALLPATDSESRYELLLAREKVYDLQGARPAQAQDLAALEELAAALLDPRRQTEVALRRAAYAEATGDYPAAVAAAQQAIELAQANQDMGRQAAGHLQWGQALWRQGNYAAARTQLEQTLALVRAAEAGTPAPAKALRHLEAEGLRHLGTVAYYLGDQAGARAWYEQSLQLYLEVGDPWGVGAALNNLGLVARSQGDYAGARDYFEQSLRLRREIGDRRGEGHTLNNLGAVSIEQGAYARAHADFEQALRLYREVGDRRGEGAALSNLGDVAYRQGDYARARAYWEQDLGICREIGDRQGEAVDVRNLGLVLHQVGDHSAGRAYSEQAVRMAIDLGTRSGQAAGLTNLGHALAGLGQLDQAAAAYGEALALRRELGLSNLAMESLAGLARVALAQGNPAQALAHVEEILRYLQAGTLDGTDEPFRVYLTCYQVLQTNADPRAQDVLATAHNLLQDWAARIGDAETRRSFLENVAAHREIVAALAMC